jgi:Leucine-rich repeat (LRR) protein
LEGSGDLSKFKDLETIDFSNNQIKEINLNENNKLKYILLSNNQIKNIDLSNNINLTDLELDKNQITEIKGLKKIEELIHILLNK